MYGKQAADIIAERPMLKMDFIPNLDIFDQPIMEKFGVGVINNALSYEDDITSSVLSYLSRNPEKLELYNKFEELTKGIFDDKTPQSLYKKLTAFLKCEKVLSTMNQKDSTKERIDNLRLAIIDYDIVNCEFNNEISHIELNTLNDLDEYSSKRNELLNKLANNTHDINLMKYLIFKKFFGISFNNTMIESFNLDSFINDERTDFSNGDLDYLKVMDVINEITDINLIKEIYQNFSKEENITNPLDCYNLMDRVKERYCEELMKSLLTPEKAKQMAESGQEGISYIQKNGFEIINLYGADFMAASHTMFCGNSSNTIYASKDNATAEGIVKTWTQTEDGLSTISTAILDKNRASYTGNGAVLGFVRLDDSHQILGMSDGDAGVSYEHRSLFPGMHKDFDYPERVIGKKPNSNVAELALFRRKQNQEKIQEGSFGGKILPDIIIAYNEISEQTINLATEFGKLTPSQKPLPIYCIQEEKYPRIVRNNEQQKKAENSISFNGQRTIKLKEIQDSFENER